MTYFLKNGIRLDRSWGTDDCVVTVMRLLKIIVETGLGLNFVILID
jgi:hypothetical protein